MTKAVHTTRFLLLLCSPALSCALDVSSWKNFFWRRGSSRNVPSDGYYNPLHSTGSFLTQVPDTFPMGQGEPLNAIISGASDATVLVDQETNGGLRNYFLSLGFSGECLGQHAGSHQAANLGDGNGYKNETGVIRWSYGDPSLGACRETVQGGNHFRYWVQDGPSGNSGAIFLAVSYEKPIAEQHDIIVDGYNLGRDYLVGNATGSTVPTSNLTENVAYTASTSFGGYTYHNDVRYVSGLLPNTSDGINHNATVGIDGVNAVDGLVAVLTISITNKPATTSAGWRTTQTRLWKPAVLLSLPLLVLT